MSKSTSKLFESETPNEMNEEAMNLPETEVQEEEKQEDDRPISDVISNGSYEEPAPVDINLSVIKKKPFRINGDPDRLIELNVSDLAITQRMSVAYDRLMKYMDEVGKVLQELPEEGEDGEKETVIEQKLQEIDQKMREEIDYIFDAPVSKACDYGGSMYDPFEGMFRFEHIMDAITKLYETNLNSEFTKMRRRINAKTSKYTKKYHR